MFLVATYLCLHVKYLKSVYNFLLKYLNILRIMYTMTETSHIRRLEVFMFL